MRNRYATALLLGALAAAALAAPALAQTSSDVPGGGSSLRPVGAGELSTPAAGPVSGSLWETLAFAVRDRIVPLAWIWNPTLLDRFHGPARPVTYVAPRRPSFKLGGTIGGR
jgi:hypothetical protein